MRGKLHVDELARRQHGIVSRAQLLAAGYERSWIDRAIASRRLHRIHQGVYAVGHRPSTNEARWMAAVVSGSDVVLSHQSAAALHGLPVRDNGLTRVTSVHPIRRTAIVGHRGDLHDNDRTVRRGIPVTTVARALADCSHVLDDEALHRAVKEAQFRGLWVDAQIRDALDRRRSARLAAYLHDPTVTQTMLEDRFLKVCRRYRIPTPLTQYGVKPRVDFFWPDRRLIVEVDGWEAHRTRVAFQDDRTHTNLLQLAGNIVLRYTWDDVRVRHADVAAQVLYAGNFSSTQSGPSSRRR
jgi:very-short-patch-repair endonuclease